MTNEMTAALILVKTPSDYMASAECPCCGGNLFVNTGRRSARAHKEIAQWTIPSHKAKGTKCAGSGVIVHYSPMVG